MIQQFFFWTFLALPFGPTALNSLIHGAYQPGARLILAPVGSTLASLTFCVAIVLGFGTWVQSISLLRIFIVAIGGLFMLYLAMKYLLSLHKNYKTINALEMTKEGYSMQNPIRDGFMCTMTNPKAFIVYISVLSPKIESPSLYATDNLALVAIVLSAVFVTYSSYALLGHFSAALTNARMLFLGTHLIGGLTFLFIGSTLLASVLMPFFQIYICPR